MKANDLNGFLFVHVSWLQAALKALRLSLQIVGAFHDVVAYLLAFAQLGNSPSSLYNELQNSLLLLLIKKSSKSSVPHTPNTDGLQGL